LIAGAKAEAATTSHTDDNDDEKPKTFKMKTPKSHKKQKQVETPVTLIKSGKRKHQAVAEKQPPGKKRKTIASPPPAAVVTPPANAQKTPVFGISLPADCVLVVYIFRLNSRIVRFASIKRRWIVAKTCGRRRSAQCRHARRSK
jgi:hypothetical protein